MARHIANLLTAVFGAGLLTILPIRGAGAGPQTLFEPSADSPLGALSSEEKDTAQWLLEIPLPPPIPDDRNAAIAYKRLFDMMRADEERFKTPDGVRWADIAGKEGQSVLQSGLPEPFPPSPDARPGEPEGYELIYSLRDKDCMFDVDWSRGIETNLYHLGRMRNLARFVALQARFDRESNRPARALEDYSVVLAMSDQVSGEASLISFLVGMSIENIALRGLNGFAGEHTNDYPLLVSAAEMLRARPDRKTRVADVVREECRLEAYAFMQLANDPNTTVTAFTDMAKTWFSDTLASDDEKAVVEGLSGDDFRRWFEKKIGLPEDSFNDDTWRTIVRKMAVFHWRESEKLVAAIEANPDAMVEIVEQFIASESSLWNKPEALLARSLLPIFPRILRQVRKQDEENRAAIERFYQMGQDTMARSAVGLITASSAWANGGSAGSTASALSETPAPSAPPARDAQSASAESRPERGTWGVMFYYVPGAACVLIAVILLYRVVARRKA